MPANFDRAMAYVRAHGDELDQLRLDVLEHDGSRASREPERRLFAGQRGDGGWSPFWAPDYSSLDTTCFRLAQCEELVGLTHPAAQRAIAFLRGRQRADGSWEEDAAIAELAPPWARPSELAPRLYLTANCGWSVANGTLHGTFMSNDEGAQRAGAYLEHHTAGDGSLPSFLHTHWLAAGLWMRVGSDELAYRTLDYLVSRMDKEVPSSSLAWMLTVVGELEIAPDHPLIRQATSLLLAQQREDGSWASEDGPDRDASATVQALVGLAKWASL